ncbi:DoxX family protein [Nocardioides sp. TF02-7]|uniref:DoxX family membrane protein n=1 Tax=Nocardioides sp. TF02-7 TaxID=2917724 RepID=UPI001F06BFB1|nr:DoxX family protein [Nocardioides sp. TF02-7]UMG91940.1 DoxX family protein [Nocardioides sp. TF02-7]
MSLTRLIARPLLASAFVVTGVHALRNAAALAPQAQPVTDRIAPLAEKAVHQAAPDASVPKDPTTWVRVIGGVQVAAGAALGLGKFPRLSAVALAATLVPSTAATHRFWEETDKERREQQMQQFFKDASLLGALVIAAGDTEGRPGLAWRARRAAKDARREAGHLASSARREAKLVKAELT